MRYDFFENVVAVFMDKYREDKKENIRNCGEKRRVFRSLPPLKKTESTALFSH